MSLYKNYKNYTHLHKIILSKKRKRKRKKNRCVCLCVYNTLMRISNDKYKNPLKTQTSGRITVMRMCGGNVLKLGFIFCKQNIISHFSGLSNRGEKKKGGGGGGGREDEEKNSFPHQDVD